MRLALGRNADTEQGGPNQAVAAELIGPGQRIKQHKAIENLNGSNNRHHRKDDDKHSL